MPIDGLRDTLWRALHETARILLTAPTGSGKSTRVPGLLADAIPGTGKIICLQPRRLAARMLARRVAAERGVALGAEVGYRVRFDHRAGARTRIVYETDGLLLRDLLGRPTLDDVAAIIFDEFHERHLFGDVLLGLALELQRRERPDLRLVVMSATLETEGNLRRLMAPCRTIQSDGRSYPVTIRHMAPRRPPSRAAVPPWESAAAAFADTAATRPRGHTLVFMPGGAEIRRTIEALGHLPAARGQRLLPLHGDLTSAAQDAAAAPGPAPSIIVATNIAETSITIDGVTTVIDCGLARQAGYDPVRGVNSLLIEPISRASAAQRAGRAGRTAPGICLRLWSETEHTRRPAFTPPDVIRLDLSETILQLRALGIADPLNFPWVDPPDRERVTAALELLGQLGAIDAATGAVTPLGRQILDYPLHPRWARLLIEAADLDCLEDAALVTALSQERDLLRQPADRAVKEHRRQCLDTDTESDPRFRLRLWRRAADQHFNRAECDATGIHEGTARRVGVLASQFLAIADRGNRRLPTNRAAPSPGGDPIASCLLAAFPDRVARRLTTGSSRVLLTGQRRGVLDRDSVVRSAPLLVAPELSQVEIRRGDVETRIRSAAAVTLDQLQAVYPDRIRRQRQTAYDADRRRVTVTENWVYLDLIVASQPTGLQPTADEAATCLADEVIADRITLTEWTPAIEQWILRLNALATWCPELDLPPIGPEERRYLTEQICHGANNAREARARPVRPTIHAWLPESQRLLIDRHAPERLTLGNGKTVKLMYEPDLRPPLFSARLQDLYDVNACPAIARGRIRVRACILAPNQRPVQITDDLASFWADGYPRVKKELRGRYPKHEWR